MSTRLRVVLLYKGKYYRHGLTAVKELFNRVGPGPLRKGPLREKLILLAKKLPLNYTLLLFQEPKGARKNRSLYREHIDRKEEY